MTALAEVRTKIDPDVKRRAAVALDKVGLSITDAVRILITQIADERRLPAEFLVPNATTQAAFRELEEGRAKSYKCASASELFEELGL